MRAGVLLPLRYTVEPDRGCVAVRARRGVDGPGIFGVGRETDAIRVGSILSVSDGRTTFDADSGSAGSLEV